MKRSPWLLALPLSAALHAGAALLVFALAPPVSLAPALFVDLGELVVGAPATDSSAVVPDTIVDNPRSSPARGQRGRERQGASPAAGRGAVPSEAARLGAPAESARPPRPLTPPSPDQTSVAPEPGAPPPPPIPERRHPPDTTSSEVPDRRDVADAASTPAASSPHETAAPMVTGHGGAGAASISPPVAGPARSGGESGAAGGTGRSSVAIPRSGDGTGLGVAGDAPSVPVTGPGDGVNAPEYARYLELLRRRIYESLQYPLVARRRSLSGTVQLEIVIQPNGAIGSVAVVQSSSHRVLDDAAVETVKNLSPLPFPPDVPPRRLRARLPVVFELR